MKLEDVDKMRRKFLYLNIHEINIRASYLKEKGLDFDVFLKSKGMNLQRDFVWTLEQKRELIKSVLLARNIPRIAILGLNDESYQVIDGKQRLNALIEFVDSKFTLAFDDGEYYINDLPEKYRRKITCYDIPCYICYEEFGKEFPDEDKILWFQMINYFGTPQDVKYLEKLSGGIYGTTTK